MARPVERPSATPRPPFAAVLFDAGGTLIHMPRSREEILVELCGDLGTAISLEQARGACLESERYYVRHYLTYTGDQGEFWLRYHAEALRYLAIPDPAGEKAARISHGFGLASVWRPYPEAEGVCRRLRESGVRLGVVSNGPTTVADLLAQAGLRDFFEVVVTSQEVGIEKPDPRIFAMALGRLGVPARQALFAGDLYEADVLGAQRAGLAAVLLDREGIRTQNCLAIRTLEELIPLAMGETAPSTEMPT